MTDERFEMRAVTRCPLQEERRGEDPGELDSQQLPCRFPPLAGMGLADALV